MSCWLIRRNGEGLWSTGPILEMKYIPHWYIPPPTAIRSNIWTDNACKLLLFCWGKQAGVGVWDGIFGFIHHFKESDENKMKKFLSFSPSWPLTLVFMFPYIFFSPAGRSGGRGCPEEHCLALLAAAYRLSSEPWEQLYSGTCFISQVKARGSGVRGRVAQIWEGKAAWKSSRSALWMGQIPNAYIWPCLHWHWWVQGARRGRGEGWWHGAVRDL